MRRLALPAAGLLTAGLLLAGCGYDQTKVTGADRDTEPTDTSSTAPAFVPTACSDDGTGRLRSYGISSSRNGPAVSAIRKKGFLTVGVAADSYLLGFRNPLPDVGSEISGPLPAGQIQGFDIDMATRVAEAIFGDPSVSALKRAGHLRLRVITPADRIPLLMTGDIDMVARNMTITCERWQQIAFSEEYYASGQQLLVRSDNDDITTKGDLVGSGLRICAPTGTTSLDTIKAITGVTPVESSNDTDCLIKFQASQTDAISTDDTVLAGLAAQDPYAKVVPIQLSDEPYGLGMNLKAVDLVRFVNSVLEQMRADGSWQESFKHWLQPSLGTRGQGAKQPLPLDDSLTRPAP